MGSQRSLDTFIVEHFPEKFQSTLAGRAGRPLKFFFFLFLFFSCIFFRDIFAAGYLSS